MERPDLVFGHACPQHPDGAIARVESRHAVVPGGERWLVTVLYRCGHRHTQYSHFPPDTVVDTRGERHPVLPEPAV